MPRTEEANQRIREETRRQVMAAAAQVFARKGLAGAKMADIAAAGGMSQGLAYRHFGSKEEVFAAVVELSTAGATRLVQSIAKLPGTPWERLKHITEEMLAGLRETPEFALVVLQALTTDAVPAGVREGAMKQALLMRKVIADLIREGQTLGEVGPGSPEELAMIHLSLIQGLSVGVSYLDDSVLTLPEADVLLRTLRP